MSRSTSAESALCDPESPASTVCANCRGGISRAFRSRTWACTWGSPSNSGSMRCSARSCDSGGAASATSSTERSPPCCVSLDSKCVYSEAGCRAGKAGSARRWTISPCGWSSTSRGWSTWVSGASACGLCGSAPTCPRAIRPAGSACVPHRRATSTCSVRGLSSTGWSCGLVNSTSSRRWHGGTRPRHDRPSRKGQPVRS